MTRNKRWLRAFVVFLFCSLLAAGCADDPLEKPGPYSIYLSDEFTISDPQNPETPIEARIYAPSQDGGASISTGPFPLIVLMPGFGATYGNYACYARHLASHGSIVVGMNFNMTPGFDGRHDDLALQTLVVIDYAVCPESLLSDHVDPCKIATAGHSLGAKIAFYAAALDPRIMVVMAMDPVNGGGPPCAISEEWCNAYPVAPNVVTGEIGLLDQVHAASLVLRAAPDVFNPDPQSNAYYFFYGMDGQGVHAVDSPALYFDMGNSGHASWLYLGSNWNVPLITKRTMVAWVKEHFNGECMDAYFTGEVVQEDIDAGFIVAVDAR